MSNPIQHLVLVATSEQLCQNVEQLFGALQPPVSVSTLGSIDAAAEFLKAYAVDLVIGECALPDGELRTLLQLVPFEQAPPIVMLISDPYDPRVDEALADGIWDYLPDSPGVINDLPHLAERLLSSWRLHQHLDMAETELATSEARLQALTGSSSDFFWELDANAMYAHVSPQVQALLGYTPGELLGHPVYDFLPAADADAAKVGQAMDAARPLSRWKHQLRHKNGQLVVVETSGVPIHDEHGQVCGFRGVDRDVTQRQQAEQVLRRREAILQAVAQAAQDLLQSTSSSLHIQPVLDRLGIAAEVSRVYVFTNGTDEQGRLCTSHMYEWCDEGIAPHIDNQELQSLPYQELSNWEEHLGGQYPIYGNIDDLTEHEQAILRPQGVTSILVVPIFVQDDWWGFIGFDECRGSRDWSKGEIDALTTAARILGAALQRRRWEAKISQLNECLLHFGPDPMVNINLVTELCGQLFGAGSAYYQRLENDALATWGHWNAPPNYPLTQSIRGQISHDVLQKGGELHVPDVQATCYADTDSLARDQEICSYFGRAVRYRGEPVGALCAVFQQPFSPSDSDRKLLAIMASAVSVEEERRAAEGELKQLATTIEQAAEAICIADLDGRIEYVNPAFERTSGYSVEELIGQPMLLFRADSLVPEDREQIWRTLRTGEIWSDRITTYRPDGTAVHEDAIISPIRSGGGRIVNYVAVKRDVTKEIQLEDQLRHAQKMESIGRLAGGVAHDFNNLLSVILGYADMALANVDETSPLHEMVTEMRDAGQRATALTQQLLAFSRKQVLEIKSVNLNNVIEEMHKMLRRMIGEDLELVTVLDPQLDPMRADPSQLQQILMNLVVNARDATPANGRITLSTRNVLLNPGDPRLTPDLEPGPFVQLAVHDTGHGMDAETRRRIFDPFYTTKERGKGTGLGLATVHGIVKQHGGDVVVESAPGEGATFIVTLPADESRREPGHTTIIDEVDPHGSETIVVVEDDYNVLSLARRILERYGYNVLAADSGETALSLVDQHDGPIHLLLSDVVMPRMNGRQVFEELRERFPELRVLYMSGYAETAIFSRGIIQEGVPLIGKPFTVEGLTSAVRDALETIH